MAAELGITALISKKTGMRFPDWQNVATPHMHIKQPIRGSLRPYRVDFCEVGGLGFRVWTIYFPIGPGVG